MEKVAWAPLANLRRQRLHLSNLTVKALAQLVELVGSMATSTISTPVVLKVLWHAAPIAPAQMQVVRVVCDLWRHCCQVLEYDAQGSDSGHCERH